MTNVSSLTTNFFPDPEDGFTTTTSGVTSSGATTVGLNSTSGLTNGAVFTGIIELGETNEQTFTGVVDTSGSQITSVVWTNGSNTSHPLGSTVVDYPTATHIAQMSKGILTHTDQDGTLKTDSVITANITDANVTTAKIADDAVTDAKRPRLKHAKVTGTDTVTNSTNFAIEFTSAVVDPEGWTDIGGTNPERVTVDEAGLYLLEGSVEFGANSTSDRRQTAIFVNGAEIDDSHGRSQARPSTGEPSFVSTQAVVVLAANDYVTLIAQQDSGGNLSCIGALTVTKLSD